jgi:hypothetical protein
MILTGNVRQGDGEAGRAALGPAVAGSERKKGDRMKKTAKRKLTLSKETIARLEAGQQAEVAGGTREAPAYSDLWPETTCMIV